MSVKLKQLNRQAGIFKRKLGLKGDLEPGALIQKSREPLKEKTNDGLSKQEVAIRGLV